MVQAMTNMPRLKSKQSSSFFDQGSCRRRISYMGKQMIIMSVMMLRMDVAVELSVTTRLLIVLPPNLQYQIFIDSTQFPGSSLSQDFLIGLHANTVSSTAARV